VQADEQHRLEWEARKRADEVRELQQVRRAQLGSPGRASRPTVAQ
jgi:hypothetical protein